MYHITVKEAEEFVYKFCENKYFLKFLENISLTNCKTSAYHWLETSTLENKKLFIVYAL